MSTKQTGKVVVTIETPDTVVEEVAEELEEIDAEPTRDAVRDRVFDVVEVSPELRADGRPVADAVRARLDA